MEPLDFLRRYLHLLGYGDNREVKDTAIHLMMLQIYEHENLDFTPSTISAAISILVVNLIEIDRLIEN